MQRQFAYLQPVVHFFDIPVELLLSVTGFKNVSDNFYNIHWMRENCITLRQWYNVCKKVRSYIVTNVRTMYLDNENGVIDGLFLQKFTNLHTLYLGDGSNIDDSDLVLLQTLKTLDLCGPPAVTDEGLKHMTNLNTLSVYYDTPCKITDKGLCHLTNLTELELYGGDVTISGEALLTLTKMKKLTLDTDLKDDFTKYLTNIKTLNLNYMGILLEDDSVKWLTTLSPLQSLKIDNRKTTDYDMVELTTKVLTLHDLYCGVTKDGLKHLFNLTDLQIVYRTDLGREMGYFKRFSHLIGLKQETIYDLDCGYTARLGECLPRLKKINVVTIVDGSR
jgi:Leucine-rich repeat (LRR) protein